MAFGNWRNYLRGREEVSLKKYLYVFRPLLVSYWFGNLRRNERQSKTCNLVSSKRVARPRCLPP